MGFHYLGSAVRIIETENEMGGVGSWDGANREHFVGSGFWFGTVPMI